MSRCLMIGIRTMKDDPDVLGFQPVLKNGGTQLWNILDKSNALVFQQSIEECCFAHRHVPDKSNSYFKGRSDHHCQVIQIESAFIFNENMG